jgi:tripartite-type tricarboxylate transporter receptor subunit TctC
LSASSWLAFFISAALWGTAHGEYPARPLRYIVASAPGGIADITARVLGPSLSKALGQPVVVENRTSGGVMVGGDLVAKSPPDGHMLLSVTPQLAIAPTLNRNFQFDPRKDLAPVALVGVIPNVLVVSAKTPANSLQDLIELARRNPGKLNYSSTGQGTSVHLAAELLKYYSKVSIVHVPYRGASAAMNALIAGDVDLMVESMLPVMPHIRSGKIRPLAVVTAQRVAQLPDVPTMIESGFPGFEMSGWTGIATTGGTPPAVIERLEAETRKALAGQEAGVALERAGVTLHFLGAREFGAFFDAEVEKFALAIRYSGVKIE